MVAARGSREDRCFHLTPALEYLPVAETQHPIASDAQLGIAPSILFEPVTVMRASVDFDDEMVADEEVHAANPWHCDLLPRCEP